MTYIIYTKSGCPNCDRVKHLLSKEPYQRIYINCDELLSTDREAFIKSMREKTGIQEPEKIYFPLVFQDNFYIGGYDELLHHLIELDEEF